MMDCTTVVPVVNDLHSIYRTNHKKIIIIIQLHTITLKIKQKKKSKCNNKTKKLLTFIFWFENNELLKFLMLNNNVLRWT